MILVMGLSAISLTSCTKDEEPEGTNTEESGSGGSSSGSGEGSYSSFTYYGPVSAMKLTVISTKVTSKDFQTLQVYTKNSKYYWKKGTYDYAILSRNTTSTFLGVSVSSYSYFTIYSLGAVSYYIFFDI